MCGLHRLLQCVRKPAAMETTEIPFPPRTNPDLLLSVCSEGVSRAGRLPSQGFLIFIWVLQIMCDQQRGGILTSVWLQFVTAMLMFNGPDSSTLRWTRLLIRSRHIYCYFILTASESHKKKKTKTNHVSVCRYFWIPLLSVDLWFVMMKSSNTNIMFPSLKVSLINRCRDDTFL